MAGPFRNTDPVPELTPEREVPPRSRGQGRLDWPGPPQPIAQEPPHLVARDIGVAVGRDEAQAGTARKLGPTVADPRREQFFTGAVPLVASDDGITLATSTTGKKPVLAADVDPPTEGQIGAAPHVSHEELRPKGGRGGLAVAFSMVGALAFLVATLFWAHYHRKLDARDDGASAVARPSVPLGSGPVSTLAAPATQATQVPSVAQPMPAGDHPSTAASPPSALVPDPVDLRTGTVAVPKAVEASAQPAPDGARPADGAVSQTERGSVVPSGKTSVERKHHPAKHTPKLVPKKRVATQVSRSQEHRRSLRASGEATTVLSQGGQPSLDGAKINSTFAKHAKAFDACVAKARQAGAALSPEGLTVTVTMTVSPAGRAAYATLDDVELGATELGNCIKLEATKLQFPPFSGEPIRLQRSLRLH
jgi:hypothetical protein